MSVTSVTEKHASRRASATVDGKRTYTRVMIVEVSSVTDDESVVGATGSGVPEKYEAYPADSAALCKEVELEQIENLASGAVIWEATCHYDSDFGRSPPDTDTQNVLLEPAIYTWSHAKFEESLPKDVEDTPYLNSFGDPFDPPPLTEVIHSILTVQRNEATFDGWLATYYTGKVNSDAFYGEPAGYIKCDGISAQGPNYKNGVQFFVVTYEMHFHPTGWLPMKILDAGPRYYDDSGNIVYSTDDNGNPSTVPTILDGTGHKGSAANPTYLEFTPYYEAPFAPLNLE